MTHINRIKKVRSPIEVPARPQEVLQPQPLPALPAASGERGGKPAVSPQPRPTVSRSGLFPPPARVMHSMEIHEPSPPSTAPALPPQETSTGQDVMIYDTFPEYALDDPSDVILVDNSEGLRVLEDGAVALPDEASPPETLQDVLECVNSELNPDAPSFVDRTQHMDTNELSHFYANDHSLISLHSEPLVETVPSSRVYSQRGSWAPSQYTKRKADSSESQVSPDRIPAAKRTVVSPSAKSVRQSVADICLRPMRMLRSRGSVPDVPNIPFPVESRAYRRALEKTEDESSPAIQDVPVPEDLPDDGDHP